MPDQKIDNKITSLPESDLPVAGQYYEINGKVYLCVSAREVVIFELHQPQASDNENSVNTVEDDV